MKRRQLIVALGYATAFVFPVRAKTDRLIGLLLTYNAGEPGAPEAQLRIKALREALEQRGWSQGQNIRAAPSKRLAPGCLVLIRNLSRSRSNGWPYSITSSARRSIAWHGEAERFGSLHVDHQFELGRLFDRQVRRLRTQNRARL
jgi:hypothetical protein